MSEKTRNKLLKYIILAVHVCVLIWICALKPATNEDEIWTYYIANRIAVKPDLMVNNLNAWSSVEAINKVMWIAQGHRFDYSFISKYATLDVHPPLYNIILHTICSIFYNNGFSFWYGYAINIIVSVMNYLVLWKLSKLVFNQDRIALLVGLVYAFSNGIFSSVLFIRFYMLASFFCLNSLYLHLKLYRDNSKKLYVYIFINTLMGMLTFYPFGIYQFFVTIIFIVMSLLKSKNGEMCKKLGRYIITLFFSAIVFLCLFPWALYQVLYGTPGSGFRDMNRTYYKDFILFYKIMSKEIFAGKFLIFLIVFLIVLIYCKVKKVNLKKLYQIKMMLYIPLIGFLLIITHMAPFNTTGRYHFIVYPILIFAMYGGLFYILSELISVKLENKRNQKIVLISCFIVLMVIPLSFYTKSNCLYDIEYLMYGGKDYNEIARKYSDADCVCIFDDYPLKLYINYSELCNYNDIFFTSYNTFNDINDATLRTTKKLVLYITQGVDEKKIVDFFIKNNNNLTTSEAVYENRYAKIVCLQ